MIQIQKARQEQKKHWRSLAQLHNAPEMSEWMEQEFPEGPEEDSAEPSRRHMFQVMGASLALAGMTACRRPEQKIVPLVRSQEGYIPGQPTYYSTAMNIGGRATGLMVEVNDFRPTKIEGHPGHPSSLGAANAQHQAAILSLYDPERSTSILQKGNGGVSDEQWDRFRSNVETARATWGRGAGLRVLSERNPSPTMAGLRAKLMETYPEAKWLEYEAALTDFGWQGTKMAFGTPVEPSYSLANAKVIVALDADFLGIDNANLADIKGFSKSRHVKDAEANGQHSEMSRLYVVEGQFSITGMNADHRLRLKASEVEQFAVDLANSLGAVPEGLKVLQGGDARRGKFLAALAKDLSAHNGEVVVIAGQRQPATVHALAALMNEKLGAVGKTVSYMAVADAPPQLEGLKALVGEMNAGQVGALLVLGGNPAHNAPAELKFADALKSVKLAINVSREYDETSKAIEQAQDSWHIPEAHFLECWGDLRALDGQVSIQQPMVKALYPAVKAPMEVVAAVLGLSAASSYELVRNSWLTKLGEDGWRKTVSDGLIPETKIGTVVVKATGVAAVASAINARTAAAGEYEVQFVPSSQIFDGRFANNSWLQECPDPITKITWGNAALMSAATARKLGVFPSFMEPNDDQKGKVGENYDRSMNQEDPAVEISKNGKSVRLPVFVTPGMADGTISVALGYGREQVGVVGKGLVGKEVFVNDRDSWMRTGWDVYPLRSASDFGFGTGFSVKASGFMPRVATTQDHHQMQDRPLVREATLAAYQKDHHVIEEMQHVPDLIQLYEDDELLKKGPYQWGMAIDLNACIGCNACVVACQAENNIPVVGRDGVIRGREMHWIRLDRYFSGSEDEPTAVVQPLNCQQCENAPCENVCPVAATAHSPEGLNDMAYNRCVGTRYCSNNCPFKVRRFNYFNYHRHLERKTNNKQSQTNNEVAKMLFNPDVSVRMRGVMEKCTYCTQRIQEKKILAKTQDRRLVRDGEIQTACQQTCPADAIVFGNIHDPQSRVSQLRKQHRNYAMLAEINIRPRTTYLAKLRNPHPELA
jgi:MoCo/4Fe-4S cofactor protein with predicted Tat translocation signal